MLILICFLIITEIILCIVFARWVLTFGVKIDQINSVIKSETANFVDTLEDIKLEAEYFKLTITEKFAPKPFSENEVVSLFQGIFKLYVKYYFFGFKYITRPILVLTIFNRLYKNRERLGLTFKGILN